MIFHWILSVLFPPKLPHLHHVNVREDNHVDVIPESGIGLPKKKKYRDGIERFYAEETNHRATPAINHEVKHI